MLTDSELTDNKFLSEVEKYGLLDDFWKLCEQHFGLSLIHIYETIKEAKRVEMRERNQNAKLYLTEALKDCLLYTSRCV